VHLKKDYVLKDELDLEQLFVVENITADCQQLKDEVVNSPSTSSCHVFARKC
jgi:hypothetical protein